MANLNLKEDVNCPIIEVGDMIVTKNLKRLIIKKDNDYLAVCPIEMTVYGVFTSLETVKQCYCSNPHRIIKSKNLTMMEE